MTANPEWTLADGELRARNNPETFATPPRSEREQLIRGDRVKLIFERTSPPPDEPSAERMWVSVTHRVGDGYAGVLVNTPQHISSLREGDVVDFGPSHVVAIDDPDEDDEWELMSKVVIVSVRSHEQRIRPGVLFRQEPTSDDDSGWAALIGHETEDDMRIIDDWLPQRVGYLLSRWPEMLPVFQTDPVNAEWEWNEDRQAYICLD